MKIGPKYKIARRLKAPIFEKTQTQKFALRSERKARKFQKQKSDFGLQLNEKQKARMFYCVSEKQFRGYVKKALTKKGANPSHELLTSLETRLDNALWRAGLLPTHLAARQAVAHGHFVVNGRKSYIPSLALKTGDTVAVREGSRTSKLFADMKNKLETTVLPSWLSFDPKKGILSVKSTTIESGEMLFDLGQVIEYYQR